MTPLYIFDLDGTLALTGHRQHILDNKDDPKRWERFFAACVNDSPNAAVIQTFNMLARAADVRIWSGRGGEVKAQTIVWLVKHTCMLSHEADEILTMRPEKDYTPDDDLKREWYCALSAHDRTRLVAVFDDRDKVVAMWRHAGVTCFQVAPGDF